MFDYALVGGGLQNGLVALALLSLRPGVRIALIERGARLGGNHTWSFHAGDVPEVARGFIEPLVTARWPGYEVNFPTLRREFATPYASVSSDRLHEVVSSALTAKGCELMLRAEVVETTSRSVRLSDGRQLEARVVIDARGPSGSSGGSSDAFQKFVGLECRLARPSQLTRPILMDASVPQTDGYRFVYVLPFEDDRLLIEDTYFSNDPQLDVPALRAGIHAYALEQNWEIAEVLREETGVLPLPLSMSVAQAEEGPLRAGYGGGFFHPTTGYSFPVALRLALLIARTDAEELFGPGLRAFVAGHQRQLGFATLLNRLLFSATAPQHRRDVLERFHRLPEDVTLRFYALETTPLDRARIICGRPPKGVSLRKAVAGMVS